MFPKIGNCSESSMIVSMFWLSMLFLCLSNKIFYLHTVSFLLFFSLSKNASRSIHGVKHLLKQIRSKQAHFL